MRDRYANYMTKPKWKYAISDPSRDKRFTPVSFMKRGNSSTLSVLRYLKMKRGVPATARQVYEVFPSFFRKPSDAARTIRTLEKRGFCESVYDGAWRVTESGVAAVYLMSQRDRLKYLEEMD